MKTIKDMRVVSATTLAGGRYALLVTEPADGSRLPEIDPGQFVQIAVEAPGVFLRRPISVNYVDRSANQLWLLVRDAGRATHRLVDARPGQVYNMILPLGNGWSLDTLPSRPLLVGGGVGVAPLLHLGAELRARGVEPVFLLGARTASDMLQIDEFQKFGPVCLSTDDGSLGVPGTVVQNPVLTHGDFDRIYCCGPAPMMKAVARVARERAIDCEVSLENMMACGLGACLCCVEKTVRGNVCVCSEGPVFNIKELTW